MPLFTTLTVTGLSLLLQPFCWFSWLFDMCLSMTTFKQIIAWMVVTIGSSSNLLYLPPLAESESVTPRVLSDSLNTKDYNLPSQFSSVQFSGSVVSNSLWPHESQHARPTCPSPTPRVYSHSCPSSWWCHPAISSSVISFSSCPQSLPASGSFSMSQLFSWHGQSIGVSALASVLPMNTQDLSPLGWTGWISLQSKGLSRVFSNTIVQKHKFFGAQLSSQSNSHIHTWPLEKP